MGKTYHENSSHFKEGLTILICGRAQNRGDYQIQRYNDYHPILTTDRAVRQKIHKETRSKNSHFTGLIGIYTSINNRSIHIFPTYSWTTHQIILNPEP